MTEPRGRAPGDDERRPWELDAQPQRVPDASPGEPASPWWAAPADPGATDSTGSYPAYPGTPPAEPWSDDPPTEQVWVTAPSAQAWTPDPPAQVWSEPTAPPGWSAPEPIPSTWPAQPQAPAAYYPAKQGGQDRRWPVAAIAMITVLTIAVLAAGSVAAYLLVFRAEQSPTTVDTSSGDTSSSDTGSGTSNEPAVEQPPVVESETPVDPGVVEAPVAVSPIGPVSVQGSSQSPDSVDDAGSPVTFNPANVADGSYQTAWRPVEGDGVGERITLDLGGTYTITTVGLVPGYTKTDPLTGRDRFSQNRRIDQVRWIFDDGSSVLQQFADVPTMQTTTIDPVRSATVTIEIISTRSPIGSAEDIRNYAPISEVVVEGGA